MMSWIICNATKGIILAFTSILLFGMVSSLLSKNTYYFSSNYENYGQESILMSYNHGRATMHVIVKNNKDITVISKYAVGFFLRFGSHYYLFTTEQDSSEKPSSFFIRVFFIRAFKNGEAVMISKQRVPFMSKNSKIIYPKSIMIGSMVTE